MDPFFTKTHDCAEMCLKNCPTSFLFSSFSHHLIGWFAGGGLETCWESCASDYTLGGAHQPFPPHKCLSRQHLQSNMVQLVQPPFGGDAGETLREGQATPEKKKGTRISRNRVSTKKKWWGHDPFLRTNTNIYGSFCSNCKRNGVCFQRSSRKLARNCVCPGSPKTSF